MIEYFGSAPVRKEDATLAPANGFERLLARGLRSIRGEQERVRLSRDLYWAIRELDAPKARGLILAGAPLEEVQDPSGCAWSAPLISAASAAGAFGVSAVELLLSVGADPDAELAFHRRPINMALLSGQWKSAEKMIQSSRNPLARDHDGVGPRLAAAIALRKSADQGDRVVGNVESTLALIHDLGADPNESLGESVYARKGARALTLTAHIPESVRELIAAGADVNARDALGATPLMLAASRQSFDSVAALLEAGADPLAVDGDDRDALDWLIHKEQKLSSTRAGHWGPECEAIVDALIGAGLPRLSRARVKGVKFENGDEPPEWFEKVRASEERSEISNEIALAQPKAGRAIRM